MRTGISDDDMIKTSMKLQESMMLFMFRWDRTYINIFLPLNFSPSFSKHTTVSICSAHFWAQLSEVGREILKCFECSFEI